MRRRIVSLEITLIIGKGTAQVPSLVEHCVLTGDAWRIGENTIVSGISSYFGLDEELIFGSKLVVRDVRVSGKFQTWVQ